MAQEPRWLTLKLAGQYYTTHPRTLAFLCRKNLIPFAKLPSTCGGRGQIRIDKLKTDALLESGEIVLDSLGRRIR